MLKEDTTTQRDPILFTLGDLRWFEQRGVGKVEILLPCGDGFRELRALAL